MDSKPPYLKAFIMSPGGADKYDNLEVRIKKGANPELIIFGSDTRIDLSLYSSTEALDALMLEHGFTIRSNANVLFNRNENCISWSQKGECLTNPAFMNTNCKLACSNLRDTHESCADWASKGECSKNKKYMYAACPVSCSARDEL